MSGFHMYQLRCKLYVNRSAVNCLARGAVRSLTPHWCTDFPRLDEPSWSIEEACLNTINTFPVSNPWLPPACLPCLIWFIFVHNSLHALGTLENFVIKMLMKLQNIYGKKFGLLCQIIALHLKYMKVQIGRFISISNTVFFWNVNIYVIC